MFAIRFFHIVNYTYDPSPLGLLAAEEFDSPPHKGGVSFFIPTHNTPGNPSPEATSLQSGSLRMG